jgi:hypothetical protein
VADFGVMEASLWITDIIRSGKRISIKQ